MRITDSTLLASARGRLATAARTFVFSAQGWAMRIPPVESLLPFNSESPLRTYHYSAYPVGILASRGPLGGPVLQRHLQVFFPIAKVDGTDEAAHVRFLPGMGFEQFAALGCLTLRPWERSRWEGRASRELVTDLASTLRNGGYLHAYVDLYYVPRSHAYGRKHFRYSTLLIGCDTPRRSFVSVGYGQDGTFVSRALPYAGLARALDLRASGLAEGKAGVEEIQVCGRPPAMLDDELIRMQLEDVLTGRFAVGDYFEGGRLALPGVRSVNLADRRGATGLRVYPLLVDYIKRKLGEKQPLDLRATRTLWEQKIITNLALGSVFRSWGSAGGAGLSRYGELVSLAQRMHLLAFAYNERCDPSAATVLLDLVGGFAALEEKALDQVLKQWNR